MKAIRVHSAGGPDGLVYEEIADPQAGAGEVVVKVEAIGMNFAEVMQRKNANPANLPAPIGGEGAGTIVEVGPGVTEFRVGDRVAFNGVTGAYAELVALPAARAVPVLDAISTKDAAAALLQGMTAHYLATDTYPLGPEDTCVVHAAAGGVGLLLCQFARLRGARVIGTVSTSEKAEAAHSAGATDTILYTQTNFADEVKRLTNGRGADVIYDSVGQTTFLAGFDCLRPRGMMVSYGQASGPVPPVEGALLSRGSFYYARAGLGAYTATRDELLARANNVFGFIAGGELKVRVYREYALAEAGKAQTALEQRETIGKVLLIP